MTAYASSPAFHRKTKSNIAGDTVSQEGAT